MGLSNDLISEFAKIVKSEDTASKKPSIYGTTVMYNGQMCVRLDGSNVITPVTSTVELKQGERVMVDIKNHVATVTGNITSPSAQHRDVQKVTEIMFEVENILTHQITADELDAINATIDNLIAKTASFTDMEAITAEIEMLKVKYADVDKLTTVNLDVLNADIDNIKVKIGDIGNLSTEDLDAINADIDNLKAISADFSYISAEVLTALNAYIENLDSKKISAEEADLKYVNIDFANIDKAWMAEFYANSGIIENIVVNNESITGRLVGVTIKGDLIEGNTIVADKLVIQGDDGIYYKLNTSIYDTVCYKVEFDSETNTYTTTDELVEVINGSLVDGVTTENGDAVYTGDVLEGDNSNTIYYCKNFVYNNERVDIHEVPKTSLDGRVIAAKSITAEQIAVSDLVAFDATIGGFNITRTSLYSGVKSSIDSSAKGTYFDNDGQIAFGDSDNYIRYYKTVDENGNEIYKLEIVAESIKFGSSVKYSVSDLYRLAEHVKIGTYTDPETGNVEPCIELSEGDTDFKQILTNTKAVFMNGPDVGTKLDSEGLTAKNVRIEDELRLGEFVWSRRSNGNCGIMWKEVSS